MNNKTTTENGKYRQTATQAVRPKVKGIKMWGTAMNQTKTTTETREALEKKCRLVKFGKDVIDHRADGYMSAPEKTIYGFEYDDIMQLIAKEKQALLKSIDPLDLVEPCNSDCTPEEHAYHQGTWHAHLKLEKKLAEMSKVLEGKGEKHE